MTPLTYGSVCSGIEAASLAWEPLGLKAAWFAEIEDFPSAVLAERWPDVPNLGDMTTIAARIRSGEVIAPDVLVGGTPCQAFSLAGLRAGLDDARGQLTLKFVELANAIDERRAEEGKPPVIIVWENVPGVLSSHDNAFGNFLAALAGELEEFEPGDRPATGKDSTYWTWNKKAGQHVAKWPQYGCVIGSERRLGWGVKDAQYYGVAQRRRRTFIVASARTDFDPTEVLPEPNRVCRDSAPSRKAGQDAAAGAGTGTENGSHWDDELNPHPTLNQSFNTGGIGSSNQEVFSQRGAGIVGAYRMLGFGHYAEDETASTVKARDHKDATDVVAYGLDEEQNGAKELFGTLKARTEGGGFEGTVVTFPAQMSGTQFAAGEEDLCQTLQAQNPTAVCIPIHDKATRYSGGGEGRENDGSQNGLGIGKETDPCPTLDTACNHAVAYAFQPRIGRNGRGDMGDIVHALSAESGSTGLGDAAPCVAFTSKDYGQDAGEEISPTLRAGNHDTSHASGGIAPAIAFAENDRGEVRLQGGDGSLTGPLTAGGGKPGQGYPAVVCGDPIRYGEHQQDTLHTGIMSTLPAGTKGNTAQYTTTVTPQMAVRRLTPVECERLQGMPDNHTLIPVAKYKKMIDEEVAYLRYHAPELPEELIFTMAKDGPRYKAIGNSMAVPVMRWIMERILLQFPTCNDNLHVEPGTLTNEGTNVPEIPDSSPAPVRSRAFLKWAGGKFDLLSDLFAHMPQASRLVEPFVGGGSVFMNAQGFDSYLLADVNQDLINLYQMLSAAPQPVIDIAREMYQTSNTSDGYDTIKGKFNEHRYNAVERAAAFLFINRHCFNGLIRYNQQGIFNVGYGKYKAPYFPESEIAHFYAKAAACVFLNAGFQKTLSLAGAGDVVYCDPPYEPLPGTDGFTGYAAGGFKWADQEALATACVKAYERGATVLITNSHAPNVVELYQDSGFKLHDLDAKRSISSKGSTREIAKDILAVLAHE